MYSGEHFWAKWRWIELAPILKTMANVNINSNNLFDNLKYKFMWIFITLQTYNSNKCTQKHLNYCKAYEMGQSTEEENMQVGQIRKKGQVSISYGLVVMVFKDYFWKGSLHRVC